MIRMDCHMHSTVSDGSFSILQLIERAKQNGLDAIVITDHDTLSQRSQIPRTAFVCWRESKFPHTTTRTVFGCTCWDTALPDQR